VWWKASLFLLGLCLRLTVRRQKVTQTGLPMCLFTAFDATFTTLLGRYRQEPDTLYCSRSGRVLDDRSLSVSALYELVCRARRQAARRALSSTWLH